jgi:hypothetical protein
LTLCSRTMSLKAAQALLTRAMDQTEQRYSLLTEKRIKELAQSGQSRKELEIRKVSLLLCGGLTGMRTLKERVTDVMGEMPFLPQRPDLLISRGVACHAGKLREAKEESNSKEKQSTDHKTTSTDQQLPSAYTVDEIIRMFKELGLPVCDDGDLIKQKFEEKRKQYLTWLGKPDPEQPRKGTVGVKNGEALQNRRPELLHIVYERFASLADSAILLDWGGQRLTPALYDKLVEIAQKQYFLDNVQAKKFVDNYVQERGFEVGETLEFQKQRSVLDIFELFMAIGLRITDDAEQIESKIRDFDVYWLDGMGGSCGILVKKCALHQNIGIYLRELLEQKDQEEKANEGKVFLERILRQSCQWRSQCTTTGACYDG